MIINDKLLRNKTFTGVGEGGNVVARSNGEGAASGQRF